MPTVGDLYGVRERPLGRHRVATASISGDYANLWLAHQPRFRARRLSIRQQRNCPSSFEVTEKRPVAMIAFPGPIVDADYCRRRELRCAAASHYPKQSVIAHLDIEPPRQCRRRPAAQRNRKAMDDFIETARASGVPFYDAVEPLSENPSLTANRVAEETPRPQDHLRGAASDR
jgi:hypothetical protein